MAGSKNRLAVMALALVFMGGCTYKAKPPAILASNIYSTFGVEIPGRFLYSFDETTWNKLMIEDSVSGFVCSAHTFPVDARSALKASIDKTMPLIFENVERASSPPTADAMRRRGITGHVIFKIEDFRSDLSYAPKFFSSDANARVDLSVGVVVTSPTGRLLATAVSGSRAGREDSVFFCEGGDQALARATSDTMREVLERLGERLSNSQKIRHAETGTPVSPTITAVRPPTIVEPRTISPPLIESRLKSNKIIGKRYKDRLMLVIGIDSYENFPRASYAEDDARTFSDFAINVLGVNSNRTKVALGRDARRVELLKAINNWAAAEIIKGKTDVYLYFSGHGLASSDGKKLYLLPYDADGELLTETGLEIGKITNSLKSSGARSVVMFLDTCYSGQGRQGETLLANARPIRLITKESRLPQRVSIFSAAANDQIASSAPSIGHGLFSYHLMKGLEGAADLNNDKKLSLEELLEYVKGPVSRGATRQGRSQDPQLRGDKGQIVAAW